MDKKKIATMEEIVSKTREIPPFPQTVLRILELTEEENCGAKDLEREIVKDQGLTANILKLANSAFYKGRRKISTVADASVLLGFSAIRSMVLASVAGKVMGRELDGYGLQKDELWEQSQISAIVARTIASKIKYDQIDQAYTAGLLKDLGKVVLDQYVGKEYDQILAIVEQEKIPFLKAEEQVLGYNHCQVGASIGEMWNLPEDLIEAIKYHHDPNQATINRELVDIVHISDSLVMMMGMKLGADGLYYNFFGDSAVRLELDEAMMSEVMADVIESVREEEIFVKI